MKKKDILTLLDLSQDDFTWLFDRAIMLKKRQKQGICDSTLPGKTLGLLFDKPSTRTRVSFEIAVIQLGGASVFLSSKDTQIARNEPIRDTARVLSRYLDGLAIRTYSQDLLKQFATFAEIPVINALTDLYHPCQILSDLLTIIEVKGSYKGLNITWIGDGNNVSHSWLNAAVVLDLNFVLACPEDYLPDSDILAKAIQSSKGKIKIMPDPFEAVKDADVIYTDVWASMGQDREQTVIKDVFEKYQLNSNLLKLAPKDVIVMHCLPAHRGEEITDEVLEGPNSVVWDQSENKLHMTKAILEMLMI